MKTIVITMIAALILLSGCAFSTYPKYKNNTYPDTNPNEIRIYPKSVEQSYTEIGIIGADVKGDSIVAIEHIKKIASKQGADAIIHFKLNQISSTEQTGCSGVAVKLVQTENVKYSLR